MTSERPVSGASADADQAEWRRVPISPYRNYEVSSDGRIRRDGKELKPVRDGDGYATVRLYYVGLSKRFKVHRLVCEAFSGPPPVGADAAHCDGSRKRVHGTAQTGERGPGAKLRQAQVDEIRRRAAAGEGRPQLAREFGIARGHLRRIVLGEAW